MGGAGGRPPEAGHPALLLSQCPCVGLCMGPVPSPAAPDGCVSRGDAQGTAGKAPVCSQPPCEALPAAGRGGWGLGNAPGSSPGPLPPVMKELKASIEQCLGTKPLQSAPEPAEPLPAAAPPDRTPTPTSTEVRGGRAGASGVGAVGPPGLAVPPSLCPRAALVCLASEHIPSYQGAALRCWGLGSIPLRV